MRGTYTTFGILAITLLVNDASARSQKYTLVDLVEQAPLIVAGRVSSKTEDVANVVVEEVVKGDGALPEIQLRDIARRIPVTPGLRLVPGEKVMLFLNTRGEFFTSDHQSKLDLSGSDRLAELVQLYLSTGRNNHKGEADATTELLELLEDYHDLSALERRFMLQVVGRNTLKFPRATIDQLLGMGMTDSGADVRWEAFAAARRLGLVLERKNEFLRGLQDADRRVRAVSFGALREKAGKTFGYDPSLSSERQPKALADWHSWATRNEVLP